MLGSTIERARLPIAVQRPLPVGADFEPRYMKRRPFCFERVGILATTLAAHMDVQKVPGPLEGDRAKWWFKPGLVNFPEDKVTKMIYESFNIPTYICYYSWSLWK